MKILTVVVPIGIVVALIAVVIVFFPGDEPDNFDRSRDSQVISALQLKDEVVLFSAGTNGIHEIENHRKIFGDWKLRGLVMEIDNEIELDFKFKKSSWA